MYFEEFISITVSLFRWKEANVGPLINAFLNFLKEVSFTLLYINGTFFFVK